MIENLHPGVFVSEIAFRAKPIDGVPTSGPGSHAAASTGALSPVAPPWTDQPRSDPGVMQLELFSWGTDGLLSRAGSQEALERDASLVHVFRLLGIL